MPPRTKLTSRKKRRNTRPDALSAQKPVGTRGNAPSIGVRSAEELFKSIPEKFRLRAPLPLPGPLSEAEIIQYFQARAAENSRAYTSFLGAGVYQHLRLS